MNDDDVLTARFEENRAHLRAVAYRMLGSVDEADDAVQESWLRLSRADTSDIDNLRGWLNTVVARVALDMLRSRRSRREDLSDAAVPDSAVSLDASADPEREALLADSVGVALPVVLETLAPIVGRSPAAARQLASRARRRVQGADAGPDPDATRHRDVVAAFLTASRGGDLDALLALLDPDVVLRADAAGVAAGAANEVRGATAVAGTFAGRAQDARLALVDGVARAVWAPGGRARVVFGFTIVGVTIVEIELLADSTLLGELDLQMLEA